MRCISCKKNVDEDSAFCKYCGTKLTAPCGECGKQEPIGFPGCQTKFEEAQEKREKYVWLKKEEEREIAEGTLEKFIKKRPLIFTLTVLFIAFLQFTFFDFPALIIAHLLILLPLIYLAWKVCKTTRKVDEAGEKAKKEYLEKFPEDAEIIKKGKMYEVTENILKLTEDCLKVFS